MIATSELLQVDSDGVICPSYRLPLYYCYQTTTVCQRPELVSSSANSTGEWTCADSRT